MSGHNHLLVSILTCEYRCGAVVGMFVDIKRWVLLYLYAGSGSFGHMPYLDSHGELDISMRWVRYSHVQLVLKLCRSQPWTPAIHASGADGRAETSDLVTTRDPASNSEAIGIDFRWWRLGMSLSGGFEGAIL